MELEVSGPSDMFALHNVCKVFVWLRKLELPSLTNSSELHSIISSGHCFTHCNVLWINAYNVKIKHNTLTLKAHCTSLSAKLKLHLSIFGH